VAGRQVKRPEPAPRSNARWPRCRCSLGAWVHRRRPPKPAQCDIDAVITATV